MNKCYHCDEAFTEPEVIARNEDYGSISVQVCPNCHRDDFDDSVTQCISCGGWFSDDEELIFYDGICRDCVESVVTPELWEEFLSEDPEMQKEFYVEYMFESTCHQVSTDLIDLCKREWKNCVLHSPKSHITNFWKYCDYIQLFSDWYMSREEIK